MAVINWFESLPSDSSEVRQTDDELRSLKTALRAGLSVEHAWVTSDGTQDAGAHLRGSARAFYDAQSNLSASNSTRGKLYLASDTSRLFGTPESGATLWLGGAGVAELSAEFKSSDTSFVPSYQGQNVRWVMEVGVTDGSEATHSVVFSTPYNGSPYVLATAQGVSGAGVTVNVNSRNSSGVTITGTASNQPIFWMSLGTRSF